MNSITIKAKHLRALAHLAAKTDIRHYLNGVFIDASIPDRQFIVATDGSVMGVIRMEGQQVRKPFGVCIPHDIIKAACRRGVDEVRIAMRRGKWCIETDATRHVFEPCDKNAAYPDWRRVLPKTVSGSAAQLCPAHVKRLHDAARDLVGANVIGSLAIRQNGEGLASVAVVPRAPEFFGLVMPQRVANPGQVIDIPAWIMDESKNKDGVK